MFNNISDEMVIFSHKVRVLFIEDKVSREYDTISNISIFFSKIDTASNYDEATQYFNNNKYDLIITSLDENPKDGLKWLSKIRDISRDITILLISSTTTKESFTELIKLGIDAFIMRPVNIQQFSEVIHKTIDKLKNKQDVYEYRINLESKLQQQLKTLRQKDEILAYQSKLAAMGEMMDAVAHQWKQPLNIINLEIDMLRYDYMDNLITEQYCDNLQQKILDQTLHMQSTLDEFRTFLRPDKETNNFLISSVIDKSLKLINDELLKNKINITKNIQDETYINGIENEFKHLILNLINNSKDAFNEKDIKYRNITFDIYIEDNYLIMTVHDNAGGIPEHVIDKIFDANITTKPTSKGTGIGLYMSKQIVQKHKGDITVKNVDDGAQFTAKFLVD
ncbi:MAG: hybrid sensor histidine kinase/response regulator [Campylobacterota bacterium]|nr:hybrid sensor histidine kinase/response regulator [Campylobacterota bacterium]